MLLFFDVETNGLPKSLFATFDDIDNWPRIVQIAWMIFDEDGKKIKNKCFIIFPRDFTISDSSAAIHGITLERAEKEGILLNKVLDRFNVDLKKITKIIAHNIDFDLPTLNAEFMRNKIETDLLKKHRFCTMKSSEIVSFCQIPSTSGLGYKWPSLSELHKIVFNAPFNEAHNALADVEACAKCYFELKKRGIIDNPYRIEI